MEHKDYEEKEQQQQDIAPQEKESWQETVLFSMADVGYILAVCILIVLLVFRVVAVSGTSMNGTLFDGDYMLLLANTFYFDPQPGDIVVASKADFEDGRPIVKRIIATEGQWVNIDFEQGIVYVSDDDQATWRALDEPYTNTPTNLQEGTQFPLYVGEGKLFVMGDNRNNSRDSRSPEIGLLDKQHIIGKVIFLLFPGTNGTDVYGKPMEERDFGRIGALG